MGVLAWLLLGVVVLEAYVIARLYRRNLSIRGVDIPVKKKQAKEHEGGWG